MKQLHWSLLCVLKWRITHDFISLKLPLHYISLFTAYCNTNKQHKLSLNKVGKISSQNSTKDTYWWYYENPSSVIFLSDFFFNKSWYWKKTICSMRRILEKKLWYKSISLRQRRHIKKPEKLLPAQLWHTEQLRYINTKYSEKNVPPMKQICCQGETLVYQIPFAGHGSFCLFVL